MHTYLFNIHTSYNYTRVIQMMLFYLMLGLAPHGLDFGFLGLGLLGLGLWSWASSFAKTNKKNFKCFGPCPFLLLITSFWFSSALLFFTLKNSVWWAAEGTWFSLDDAFRCRRGGFTGVVLRYHHLKAWFSHSKCRRPKVDILLQI